MTLTQLRHRINRAHDELSRLSGGSDERQELEQAVEQMDEEYRVGLRETLSTHWVDTEDRTLAEVRKALAQVGRGAWPATERRPDTDGSFPFPVRLAREFPAHRSDVR